MFIYIGPRHLLATPYRWKAQVGRRGIGDAPIFFVPAIVIRLARLGQKLEAISDEVQVVWCGSADGRVQSSVSELLVQSEL